MRPVCLYRYRVRVICDCPTCIEFVDDAPADEQNVKYLDGLFEEEELLKLPAKYANEDLMVCENSLLLVSFRRHGVIARISYSRFQFRTTRK